jgi:excisionase family DNA binding protein
MRAELHLDLENEIRRVVREELAAANGISGGYLSTRGAAAYLDLTTQAINSMVKRGVLTPVRRRPRLFAREDLDAWVRDAA